MQEPYFIKYEVSNIIERNDIEMPADLHLHSTFSDGSFTPAELVKTAAEKGLTTIALADHDTVEGIPEAIKAGEKYEVEVIPALEFSAFWNKAEIHILGYFIDYNSPELLNKTEEIFTARIERARGMVKRLNQLGIAISFQEVEEIAGDEYIGRPHIARAMMSAGYIEEMGEAFTDEFIGNGGKAYLSKYQLTPEKAISLINRSGGISVLAHPVFINHGEPFDRAGIRKLADAGLAGVEVYHSRHSSETSRYYLEIAEELGLIVTGGSDFHGENSPDVKIGDISINDNLVKKLKEYKR